MTELSDQKHYTRKNYEAQSLVYETLIDEIKRKIHKKLKKNIAIKRIRVKMEIKK
jgi:hypothetical protein